MNYTSKNTTASQNINRLTAIGLPIRNIFTSLISFFLLSFFAVGVKAQHINNHKQDVRKQEVPVTKNSVASKTAAAITSTGAGGLWSQTATWVGRIVPTADDDVTIADGATVTVDMNTGALGSLTVGQGSSGILQYEATTARTVTTNGNVIIAPGGAFKSASSGSVTTHSLVVGGDLINNGTLNFS